MRISLYSVNGSWRYVTALVDLHWLETAAVVVVVVVVVGCWLLVVVIVCCGCWWWCVSTRTQKGLHICVTYIGISIGTIPAHPLDQSVHSGSALIPGSVSALTSSWCVFYCFSYDLLSFSLLLLLLELLSSFILSWVPFKNCTLVGVFFMGCVELN